MKTWQKYALVALIAFALGAAIVYNRGGEPEVKTETVTDTIVTTTVDSTKIKFLEEELKKEKANVKTVTIKIPVPSENGSEPDSVEVETKKYTGKEELTNGTIDYEIYADSLYALKFDLTTKDTVINNTTTITKTLPPKSRLYLSVGAESTTFGSVAPQAISAGLMYNRRQKWGVGIEVRHDFSGLLPPQNATTVGLKAYIGLGKN